MTESGDDEACQITKYAGGERGDQKAGERFAPAPFVNKPRSIGADAEIRGVAERNNSGKAEDQIERKHEQRGNGDLARQQEIVGGENEREEGGEPKGNLAPARGTLR